MKVGEIQRILADQLELLDKVEQSAAVMHEAGSAADWMKPVFIFIERYWLEQAMDFRGLIPIHSKDLLFIRSAVDVQYDGAVVRSYDCLGN